MRSITAQLYYDTNVLVLNSEEKSNDQRHQSIATTRGSVEALAELP
jgi:hypothetical protein